LAVPCTGAGILVKVDGESMIGRPTPKNSKGQIEHALRVLLGKAMTGSGRAADMEMFHFGKVVEAVGPHGRVRQRSELSIHVQSPWRIVRSGQIVVGYRDMRDPPDGGPALGFDPNEAMATRRDELLRRFHEEVPSRPRIVIACAATSAGDVRLAFDDDSALEIFPDSTAVDDEYWRLLGPNEEHIVMASTGLTYLPPPE